MRRVLNIKGISCVFLIQRQFLILPLSPAKKSMTFTKCTCSQAHPVHLHVYAPRKYAFANFKYGRKRSCNFWSGCFAGVAIQVSQGEWNSPTFIESDLMRTHQLLINSWHSRLTLESEVALEKLSAGTTSSSSPSLGPNSLSRSWLLLPASSSSFFRL